MGQNGLDVSSFVPKVREVEKVERQELGKCLKTAEVWYKTHLCMGQKKVNLALEHGWERAERRAVSLRDNLRR